MVRFLKVLDGVACDFVLAVIFGLADQSQFAQ
jgi:hypothetical protein